MTLINANKILSELSRIEERIEQLEKLASCNDIEVDFEVFLMNYLSNKKNQ